jgi:hypothetical protein
MNTFPGALDDIGKMERAIGLGAIATSAQKLVDAGANDLEVNTFIQGAERELARQRPDVQKMGEASKAAQKYQELATSF